VSAIEDLRARLGEIGDISRAAALLAWDERTMMPVAGGEARSNQHATLAKVRHEMFCDDEIGRLLESAAGDVDGAEPGESSEDSINADLVRLVSRDWEKARRVPSELRAEMARAGSIGEQAWVEARKASDFSMLLPHLEKNVELARRYADCYEGFEDFSHPYDPLLDEYEPQMGTEAMRSVLGELREGLVPIVKEATEGEPASSDDGARDGVAGDVFHGDFPEAAQQELIAEMIGEMPFPEGNEPFLNRAARSRSVPRESTGNYERPDFRVSDDRAERGGDRARGPLGRTVSPRASWRGRAH
jgi:carboxypeptidase Taq